MSVGGSYCLPRSASRVLWHVWVVALDPSRYTQCCTAYNVLNGSKRGANWIGDGLVRKVLVEEERR